MQVPFKPNSPLPQDAAAHATHLQKPGVSQPLAGKLHPPSQPGQGPRRKTQADTEQHPDSEALVATEMGEDEQALHAAAHSQGDEAPSEPVASLSYPAYGLEWGLESVQTLIETPDFVTLAQAQPHSGAPIGTVPQGAMVGSPSGSVPGPGAGASASASADGAEKSDDDSAAPLVGLAFPGGGLLMGGLAILGMGSALRSPDSNTQEQVPANQAPTLAGLPTTTQSATVGQAAALADFTVADADGGNLSVTLTPINGTLGNVVDADTATAGIQLTGTAANINAALAAATFTPTAAGAASMGISVSDGVASPVTGTYNLTAVAPNQAPTLAGIPTIAQSATVGQPAALADFTVADADGGNLRVTLTPTNGTLGNVVDADAATEGIQLTGTAASINAALAAATFTPTAAGAASIGISLSDGVASPVTGTYNLTAVAPNRAPTLAGIPTTAQSATVGQPAALADFTVADADGDNLRVTLTPTNGTLGNVVDADAATVGIQLTGTAASINAALAAATFTPTAANGAGIGISVSDGVASPITDTYVLTAVAPNQAPTLAGIPTTAQSATVGQAAALADFTVADADSSNLRVTLTPTNGTLGNLTDADAATAGIQLTGTAASINAALAAATFTPTAAGAASIGISLSDGVASPVTGTYNLTAATANTAPTFFLANQAPGKTVVPVGSMSGEIYRATLQADGKVVVVVGHPISGGNQDFRIVRVNADGSPDTSFSGDGHLSLPLSAGDDSSRDVIALSSGKLLVVGQSFLPATGFDFALARLNADGSLDTSFSGDGMLLVDFALSFDLVHSVVEQADGKLVLAGNINTPQGRDFGLIRLNPDGSLDSTFNGTGKLTVGIETVGNATDEARSVIQQADGKLVVAGFSDTAGGGTRKFSLIRVNTDGTLDTSFSGDGKVLLAEGSSGNEQAFSVIQQADGKLVAVGLSGTDFLAYRLHADGSLDTSFGTGGKVLAPVGPAQDFALEVVQQADGKLVVGGHSASPSASDSFSAVRLNTDGSLDTTFGTGGKVLHDLGSSRNRAYALLLQPDGKLVLAGEVGRPPSSGVFDVGLIRLNTDGSLDTSFGGRAFSTLGDTASYTEGAAPVVLDSSVQVVDAELAALNNGLGNYSGAILNVALEGGLGDNNLLFINPTGASFTVVGSANTQGVLQSFGQTFATFDSRATQLSITFTGSGTPPTQALVNDVASRITYASTDNAPPATVNVRWEFYDENHSGSQGTGGVLRATGLSTVNVTPVNDAPTLAGLPTSTQSVTVGAAAALDNFTVADPDGTNVNLSVTLRPFNGFLGNVLDADVFETGIQLEGTAASINAALANVTFTATELGEASLSVSVSDGQAARATTYRMQAENAPAYTPGQAVIDLGEFGQLINPVNVDGQFYYAWDLNGDGVHNIQQVGGGKFDETGAVANAAGSGFQFDFLRRHDVLDNLFVFQNDFATAKPVADTTNDHRFATLNGVKLALPTLGHGFATLAAQQSFAGTPVDNLPAGESNPTYNDLLAIWDGFNGSATVSNTTGLSTPETNGLPTGWHNAFYAAATPSPNGHAMFSFTTGVANNASDFNLHFMALQVIAA